MGNQIVRLCCYQDQELSLDKVQLMSQDFQGINTLFKYLPCDFCRIQLNFLIQSNYANENQEDNEIILNYNRESHHFKRNPWYSAVFNNSETQFSQPTAFLHNDRIHEVTTSWFQLYLAQPKYQKEIENCAEGSADHKFIMEGHKLYKIDPTPQDIMTLFVLRWVGVEYFTGEESLNTQKQLLNEGVQLYETIAHICRLYRNILMNYKNDEQQLMIIYSKLWKKYIQIMESVMQYYDQLQDQIQIIYGYWESQGLYKQISKQKIPHLKLIGIMARFWCQIVGQDIKEYLSRSFRYLYELKQIPTQQLKEFINDIVDISFNETDIHWIGHSQKSNPNDFLKDILNYLNENRIQYFDQLVNQQENNEEIIYDQIILYLREQIQIFPQWLYDSYIEQPTIQYMLHYLQGRLSKSGFIKVITVSTKDSEDKFPQISAIGKQTDESYEKVSLEQVIQTNLVINQDRDSLMAHFIDKIKESQLGQSSYKLFKGKKQSINDSSIFSTNCSLHPSQHSLEISQKQISQQSKILLSNINCLNVKLIERIILRDALLEDRALFKQIPQDRQIDELNFDQRNIDVRYVQEYDYQGLLLKNLTLQYFTSKNQKKKILLKKRIDEINLK